jgi:hypothetical protein
MISSETVEKACSQVGQYSDEDMVREFDRFFRAQPAVCEFVIDLTQGSGQKIQELSLFLSYMVFKTIEVSDTAVRHTVTPEHIEAACRETESWMERLSQIRDTDSVETIVSNLQRDTEPHLLQYVISEITEPMESGEELNEEEKGEVFFVLKTVISSFCTGGERPRIL